MCHNVLKHDVQSAYDIHLRTSTVLGSILTLLTARGYNKSSDVLRIQATWITSHVSNELQTTWNMSCLSNDLQLILEFHVK